MIIPQYWATATDSRTVDGRQVSIKRYGWSDESQEQAEQKAAERLKQAFEQVQSGAKVTRVERKEDYSGSEGVPIREEVVSRHKAAIITRNSYGALCMNTPNVLFADVDFDTRSELEHYWWVFLPLAIMVLGLNFLYSSGGTLIIWLLGGALAAIPLTIAINKAKTSLRGGKEEQALKPVKAYAQKHPDWHLRIYRTPAGLRVLAMHRTFEPDSPETHDFMSSIKADAIYIRMCRNQKCFRARLTPKPWRIGYVQEGKPRPGEWPPPSHKKSVRQRWISGYEKASQPYAACRYLMSLGSTTVNVEAEYIRKMHDQYCKADQRLDIA
ncbi:hypothetical protein [Hahella ganghwensis]|uniref:hypothetical protein n=1 Tax=Hahella ganghwensis TaxID=286420 RepID=UPI00036303FE|nr:hypothetical protein [Hahella ganghwensis]